MHYSNKKKKENMIIKTLNRAEKIEGEKENIKVKILKKKCRFEEKLNKYLSFR